MYRSTGVLYVFVRIVDDDDDLEPGKMTDFRVRRAVDSRPSQKRYSYWYLDSGR